MFRNIWPTQRQIYQKCANVQQDISSLYSSLLQSALLPTSGVGGASKSVQKSILGVPLHFQSGSEVGEKYQMKDKRREKFSSNLTTFTTTLLEGEGAFRLMFPTYGTFAHFQKRGGLVSVG